MKDIYETITNRIIEQLEHGIIPWQKEWSGTKAGAISRTTGKPYSLINQFYLRKAGEYATFSQIKREGGMVSAAAKAEKAVNYILGTQEA